MTTHRDDIDREMTLPAWAQYDWTCPVMRAVRVRLAPGDRPRVRLRSVIDYARASREARAMGEQLERLRADMVRLVEQSELVVMRGMALPSWWSPDLVAVVEPWGRWTVSPILGTVRVGRDALLVGAVVHASANTGRRTSWVEPDWRCARESAARWAGER